MMPFLQCNLNTELVSLLLSMVVQVVGPKDEYMERKSQKRAWR